MGYRCPKCNIDLNDDSVENKDFEILDLFCSSGNCPIDDINEKNGCKLCGASYSQITKTQVINSLKQK